ncbi:MAG: hypothetical protein OXG23_08995, partial [Chloroflexi bacterium]|nr:hypothetical protein [Chloroflexota bacterium]
MKDLAPRATGFIHAERGATDLLPPRFDEFDCGQQFIQADCPIAGKMQADRPSLMVMQGARIAAGLGAAEGPKAKAQGRNAW